MAGIVGGKFIMHRADTFDQKTLVKNLKIKMICMHFVSITYNFDRRILVNLIIINLIIILINRWC